MRWHSWESRSSSLGQAGLAAAGAAGAGIPAECERSAGGAGVMCGEPAPRRSLCRECLCWAPGPGFLTPFLHLPPSHALLAAARRSGRGRDGQRGTGRGHRSQTPGCPGWASFGARMLEMATHGEFCSTFSPSPGTGGTLHPHCLDSAPRQQCTAQESTLDQRFHGIMEYPESEGT